MSMKSTLAKAVPQSIVNREIAKGSHAGDSWGTVLTIINRMCETRQTKDGVDYVYEGKVIGWQRNSGEGWCDHNAYIKMREAYRQLPPEEEPSYPDDEGDGLEYLDDTEPVCEVDWPTAYNEDFGDDDVE